MFGGCFSDFVCAGVAVDNPNAVVVGLAPSQFHYNQLNEAFRSAKLQYVHLTVCIMYIRVTPSSCGLGQIHFNEFPIAMKVLGCLNQVFELYVVS